MCLEKDLGRCNSCRNPEDAKVWRLLMMMTVHSGLEEVSCHEPIEAVCRTEGLHFSKGVCSLLSE